MNGKWPPIVSMLPLPCYFILWDLPHFTCFGCYPSFLQCCCLFIQTTLISRNVYDKNIVFLSSISTDYSWILPVIPWKHEILMLLYVSFSFSIKLLVNLFSVRNLQYFLWRFLSINILFLNFVPHFSFLFKTPFLTLKISWHVKTTSRCGTHAVGFLFLQEEVSWKSLFWSALNVSTTRAILRMSPPVHHPIAHSCCEHTKSLRAMPNPYTILVVQLYNNHLLFFSINV